MHASVAQEARLGAGSRSTSLLTVALVPATMVSILAVALLILLTPIWTHFAMSASAGPLATQPLDFSLSDRTVFELLFGPGTFSAFTANEAAHMRDVRVVLYAFLALAAASLVLLAWSLRRHSSDPQVWRSISRGGAGLIAILLVLGVVGVLAFGVAFELFHELLFPGGNWSFPPTSLLIQLYPIDFWQLSAAAFGVLGIGMGLVVWLLARRRARRLATEAGR